MKRLALLFLLAPALANAGNCRHEESREITPSLTGVTHVRFEVDSHDLRLTGDAAADQARLDVHACASTAELLRQLDVKTRRDGDTLVIVLERDGAPGWNFGSSGLTVQASLPAGLAYTVDVGSGDAAVRGVDRLVADVGSGELSARDIAGAVEIAVGSGDADIDGVGSLHVLSVGSGDLEAVRVRGDVRVDAVGSGDVEIDRIGGNAQIRRVNSGSVSVTGVDGDLHIGRVGSGEVLHQDIRGRITMSDG
ncbi:hypothetical protein [Arenimonas composti]|uniref:Auto-transporter adhesin head GIN domain-containing protein n=1 Tax=Arenimonas composti TR7-09 = DSM 18010 TaxID=1121013 RepID=A0A091BGK0_9GAMM|nr:hypothetical protein [Arenimonas composti]KFN50876.1 hypothetical protein P873_00580 [Arenimonas composti TR7-09 = DSM 18010]